MNKSNSIVGLSSPIICSSPLIHCFPSVCVIDSKEIQLSLNKNDSSSLFVSFHWCFDRLINQVFFRFYLVKDRNHYRHGIVKWPTDISNELLIMTQNPWPSKWSQTMLGKLNSLNFCQRTIGLNIVQHSSHVHRVLTIVLASKWHISICT